MSSLPTLGLVLGMFVCSPLLIGCTWITVDKTPAPTYERTIPVPPPADGSDAGPAIRAAIADAIASGVSTRIALEPGEYRIGREVTPDPNLRVGLFISGAENLVIEGAGPDKTRIVYTDPRGGGVFQQATTDVGVRGVAFDYDPVPFTQGTVLEVNEAEGWFTMHVDSGFPLLDHEMFTQSPKPFGRFGVLFDRETGWLQRDVADFLFMDTWQPTGDPQVWRMVVAPESTYRVPQVEPGMAFVQLARGGMAAFFAYSATRPFIEDCVIHTSSGLAVGSVVVDALRVTNLAVKVPEGSGRLLTTVADGVHCQNNLIGPTITGSYFSAMADDGVNVYSICPVIHAVEGTDTLVTSHSNGIFAGDRVMVYDPDEGRDLLRANVVSVELVQDGTNRLRVRVDTPIPGEIQPGDTAQVADHLYNLTRTGGDSVIQGNTFVGHRRYGIMMKAPGAVISGNTFEGLGANAVVVGNDPDWPEGALSGDVRIVDNTIRNIGISRHYSEQPTGAGITVYTKARRPGGIAAERLLENVIINSNTIINPPSAGVYVGAAQHVTVRGNTIRYEGDAARLPREASAIVFANTDNAEITGNTISSTRPEITAGIDLADPGNGPAITETGNTVRLAGE